MWNSKLRHNKSVPNYAAVFESIFLGVILGMHISIVHHNEHADASRK